MRQAAEARERDVRSGSDCGDSDGETGPSAAFHRQRSLRLPHPHLGSLPRCPPLLQLHCSGTGPGQGLSEMPAGLRGLALDIAAEWLDEYFTHGWCACAFPLAAGQAATRGHGVRAQRSGSGSDVERAAVAMARSMLTPRLSSRVSPRELKALVSISVRAVRQEWGQRRGVGKGWEACGGRGAAEAWGNRYAPPRIYKVVGPGTLSSQLLEGYLLDGVGLGSDARRKRALLSKVDDGRGGGAESQGVLGGLVLFSIALEPSPPTAGHSAVTWECRGRADGGTGCGSEAWVAAGLSALSALVDKLASWHVRVLVCQVSDCLLICSIICLAILVGSTLWFALFVHCDMPTPPEICGRVCVIPAGRARILLSNSHVAVSAVVFSVIKSVCICMHDFTFVHMHARARTHLALHANVLTDAHCSGPTERNPSSGASAVFGTRHRGDRTSLASTHGCFVCVDAAMRARTRA